MKILKCFCNDDTNCPFEPLDERQSEGRSTFLRHCLTNTVCLTKRLRRKTGTTWLLYFCDQSTINSIREKVIEYRDCKINFTNKLDAQLVVKKSAEYCCDSHEYCNRDLNPFRSFRDSGEYSLMSLSESGNKDNHLSNNNNNNINTMSLLTIINLVLLTSIMFILFQC